MTVSGGHVYIGSEKAQLYALNTSDSTVAWQTRVAGEALSRPVVSDGMVLVHTSNGQLQALNETDGAVKWTVNLDMPALSCAASLRLRPPTARRSSAATTAASVQY